MRWVIEISVADDAVADGVDLGRRGTLADALDRAFPLAGGGTFGVEILHAPEPGEIRRLQGYES